MKFFTGALEPVENWGLKSLISPQKVGAQNLQFTYRSRAINSRSRLQAAFE